MIVAHVAGVPVEELAPFALVTGAGLLAWLRVLVARLRYSHRARTARNSSSTTAI
jgi:hypothetical protein